MLPQITLSGSVGAESTSFSDLFKAGSGVWSIGASIAQPLFKGGQLLHQRRAAVAAADEASANYQATVINAFQNVSDTLHALAADADTLLAQDTAAKTAAESLKLVQAQYTSGAASYLQVLTAEQTYQNAAVALVRAQAQRFADTAALFQALGGGWWNRPDIARQM
jgi:outer membrane protein TolC